MISQAYQMMCSSGSKRPETHGEIWQTGNICPQTGKPYSVCQQTYREDQGNRVAVGDKFVCSQCGEVIKKVERDPHITYA